METGNAVVDTFLLIDHFRSKQKDNTILYQLSEKCTLPISSVSKFEFLVGAKPDQMDQINVILRMSSK